MPKSPTLNRFPLFGLFAHKPPRRWATPKTMLDCSATPRPCSTRSSRPRPKRRRPRRNPPKEGTAHGDRGQDQAPSVRRAGVPSHLWEGQAAQANRRRPRSPRCRGIRFSNQGEVPRGLVRPSRQGVRQVPCRLRSRAVGQACSTSTRRGGTRTRSASIASIWKSWRRGLRNGRGRWPARYSAAESSKWDNAKWSLDSNRSRARGEDGGSSGFDSVAHLFHSLRDGPLRFSSGSLADSTLLRAVVGGRTCRIPHGRLCLGIVFHVLISVALRFRSTLILDFRFLGNTQAKAT